MNRLLKTFFCLALLTAFYSSGLIAAPEYSLAVVPQLPKKIIHRDWAPFVHQLSKTTGLSIKLVHHDSITEFGKAIAEGELDLALMNPYQLVHFHASQGYVPLVRDSERRLTGILVVRKDSPIRSIGDLAGQTIAFPSPNAFAASLYIRALLAEAGIHFQPMYVTTHANVYRNVVMSKTSAGGGVMRTLEKEPAGLQKHLRVLYKTPETAAHPLAAHPRISATERRSIIDAIMAMAESGQHRSLLDNVQLNSPVVADYDRDYRRLEKLQLERFETTFE